MVLLHMWKLLGILEWYVMSNVHPQMNISVTVTVATHALVWGKSVLCHKKSGDSKLVFGVIKETCKVEHYIDGKCQYLFPLISGPSCSNSMLYYYH